MARLTQAQVEKILLKEFRYSDGDSLKEFVTDTELAKWAGSMASVLKRIVNGTAVYDSATEQVVLNKTITLTRDEFLGLSTAAIELLPAPEAGYAYVLLPTIMRQDSYTAAYTTTLDAPLVIRDTNASTGTALQFIPAQIYTAQTGAVQSAVPTVGLTRTESALFLQAPYNTPSAAFATLAVGTGTTFSITLSYLVIPA
jgi:hypothetical protein